MIRELFDHKSILWGGVMAVLALFLTVPASAAPVTDKSKTTVRATATELDPIALRPAWISRISVVKPASTATTVAAPARPTTSAVTSIGPRVGIFSASGSVRVPFRPVPRSPFIPPWGR